MKRIIFLLSTTLMIWGCQENESAKKDSDLTGNQSVYVLQSGSQYAVSGTVIAKEKKDGTAQINIELTGTDGDRSLPVHLHLGNTGVEGASVAALLNPVDAATGKSETLLTKLADESSITYKQLIALNACVKVHLSSSGPDQNVVLAAGNIGKAALDNAGRTGIATCKSE
jgi:hypothetical protein